MALVNINWKPTNRQLRQFGAASVVALPAIAWLWNANTSVVGILALVGLCIAIIALVVPKAVKPIYLTLTILALPIGLVVGELSMLLIYYFLMLPIGIVFRLSRRDALQVAINRNAPTYWQAKKHPTGIGSYYRQS